METRNQGVYRSQGFKDKKEARNRVINEARIKEPKSHIANGPGKQRTKEPRSQGVKESRSQGAKEPRSQGPR